MAHRMGPVQRVQAIPLDNFARMSYVFIDVNAAADAEQIQVRIRSPKPGPEDLCIDRGDNRRMVRDKLDFAVTARFVRQALVKRLPIEIGRPGENRKTSLLAVERFVEDGQTGRIWATRPHAIQHRRYELSQRLFQAVLFDQQADDATHSLRSAYSSRDAVIPAKTATIIDAARHARQ